MPRIKIIRAALREIQKLSYLECEQVYEILRNLSQERDTDTILLEKYSKLRLLRTRKGKVRVIWKKDDDNDIVIIKAGYRDDVYQEDLTERDFDNQELITESELFAASQLEEIECSENPAYSWNPQKNSEWYKYFYGDYRYSPVLTSYQRNQLEGLLTKLSSSYWNRDNHGFSDKASIIQSAPGTGKTVCATLLACEIHRQQEWNIILIVPHGLRQDVAEYLEVKQVLQKNNFWLVTFRELLGRLNPEFKDKIALPEVELASFIKAANHINRNLSHISYRDVLLYQSFILDKENNNQEKNAIFKVNQKRIEDLQRINPEKWLQELKPKKSRFEIATELKNNIPELPFDNPYTLIIVDEAQDLMLCELQALIKTYEEWNKQQNLTNLWLLGDLNQRIQPTDFNWGQLKIGEPISLERNYRNSRYILEFANQFWYLAEDINNQFRAKHLPAPTNPENAFEIGEKVRIFKCDSQEDALNFLQKLAHQCQPGENNRYLLRNLANAIKVISNQKLDINDENLIILDAENAKGREFETCVACGLFQGTDEPSLEEAFQWYTLLTRARSRLLIVLTSAELNRLNSSQYDYFENCLTIDFDSAIGWITELASDIDITQISDVKQRLLRRCETGKLYWDTYLALQLAGIEENELYQWEKDAIYYLKKHSDEYLKSELNHIQDTSLLCLLWRTMEFSWQAVIEAEKLEKVDFKQYQHLLNSIAGDLENKGLTYEAARLKARLDKDNSDLTFPFWQEISKNSTNSQPLISLLCEAFASRIENIFEIQDINK